MAAAGVTIDTDSITDNPIAHRVEFRGETGGGYRRFAIPYRTLDALSGTDLLDEPAAAFPRLAVPIAAAAARALHAGGGGDPIVIDTATLPERRALEEAEAHPS